MRTYRGQTKTLKHLQASLLGNVATAWEPCPSVPALGSEITLQIRLGKCHPQGFGSPFYHYKMCYLVFLRHGNSVLSDQHVYMAGQG